MPKSESKSTSSRSQLRAVRTPKQWAQLDGDINRKVAKLINGEDESARILAHLVNLIHQETERSDQEIIVNTILSACFSNSCDFYETLTAWMNQHAPENREEVRRRA